MINIDGMDPCVFGKPFNNKIVIQFKNSIDFVKEFIVLLLRCQGPVVVSYFLISLAIDFVGVFPSLKAKQVDHEIVVEFWKSIVIGTKAFIVLFLRC